MLHKPRLSLHGRYVWERLFVYDEHEPRFGNRATRISPVTSIVSKRLNRTTSLHCGGSCTLKAATRDPYKKTEEEEAEKFIHTSRIVRIHTNYLFRPYTHYQTFVRRLRQAEDEAGAQCVLHPVSAAQRDATKRPDLKELLKQSAATVQPRVLRPRTGSTSSPDDTEANNPYPKAYRPPKNMSLFPIISVIM
jgi:hypothetical protein